MPVRGTLVMWCHPHFINGQLNKQRRRSLLVRWIVIANMSTDILVSRTTLKHLGIIPWSFPQVGNGGYKYKEYTDEHCSFQTKIESPESKLPDELAAEVKCIQMQISFLDVTIDFFINFLSY